MKYKNQEHVSFNKKLLTSICEDYPNDQKLGEYIRSLTSATDNNPKGTSDYEPELQRTKRFEDPYKNKTHTVYEDEEQAVIYTTHPHPRTHT